jgi:hypothetical protein
MLPDQKPTLFSAFFAEVLLTSFTVFAYTVYLPPETALYTTGEAQF